jgi:hypothetical protein
MKMIIFTLVPIVIIAILNNKGFIPNTIYYILLALISIIGSIYFWYRYTSIITRDNMNYEEYDWYFDPSKAPSGSSDSTDPWATSNLPGTCIGEACCSDGQTWDSTLNQCVGSSIVGPPATPAKKESFINNVLTKTSGSYKPDVNLNEPMPTNSESFINY